RERARTERRFVRSTVSGVKVMREEEDCCSSCCGDLRRCSCRRERVSEPFFALRVVKITVRDRSAGCARRKSSTSRQQIEKPRPLFVCLVVSLVFCEPWYRKGEGRTE